MEEQDLIKINVQILPTMKDYFKLFFGKKSNNTLFSSFDSVYWLNRSSTSIEIVCKTVCKKRKRAINVWIPQYFCGETLNSIRNNDNYNLVFYPITKKLMPDYKLCANLVNSGKPDVFIFVHYFGNYLDVAAAKNFCSHHGSLLVEDCAHVLFPDEKFGHTGDCAIFSPHKCFQLADGAALCVNLSKTISIEDNAYIGNLVKNLPYYNSIKLYVRMFIKKIIGIKPKGTYSPIIHYDKIKMDCSGYRISPQSEILFSCVNNVLCRKYKYYRIKNLKMMNHIMNEYDLPIKSLNVLDEKSIPYIGAFEITNVESADSVKSKLEKLGFPIGVWTYLPFETKNINNNIAQHFSRFIFTIPVHQQIDEEKLIRSFSVKIKTNNEDNIKLTIFDKELDGWNQMLIRANRVPITQDYMYGRVKAAVDNLNCENYLIKQKDIPIGIVQVLIKKIFVFSVARINKGPILFDDNIDNNVRNNVILKLKNRFSFRHLSALIIAPNIEYSACNTEKLIQDGFHKLKYTNKYTSFIDLSKTKEKLRSELKSKWRNQLKMAEKYQQNITEIVDGFDNILVIYRNFMKEKKFTGIPIEYLSMLNKTCPNKLKVYGDYYEKELVAFDIVYIHGNTATYLVGWENDVGRKIYSNNYLIFNLLLKLKENNVTFFDLGGLGVISAPSIAKFKLGVSGNVYEYIGEYFSI